MKRLVQNSIVGIVAALICTTVIVAAGIDWDLSGQADWQLSPDLRQTSPASALPSATTEAARVAIHPPPSADGAMPEVVPFRHPACPGGSCTTCKNAGVCPVTPLPSQPIEEQYQGQFEYDYRLRPRKVFGRGG